MMKTEDENGVTYEGYCVDLIKKIADDLKFQYKIKEVDDGSYGRKNDLGEWNGMIRELIDGVNMMISSVNKIENGILLYSSVNFYITHIMPFISVVLSMKL